MRLAVVIPVRDRAVLLKRTLDALDHAIRRACDDSSRTADGLSIGVLPRPTVVVVDNGSTDSSREVAAQHPVGVVVLDSTATTVAAVRNAGAAAV